MELVGTGQLGAQLGMPTSREDVEDYWGEPRWEGVGLTSITRHRYTSLVSPPSRKSVIIKKKKYLSNQ